MFRRRLLPQLGIATLILSGFTFASLADLRPVPTPKELGRRFDLVAESSYSEGCLSGICGCPVLLHDDLKGSFYLRPEAGPRDYALEYVRLVADGMAGSKVFVGSGRYVIDDRMHRMTLELSSANGEPALYDSGWVERPRNTAGIVISVPLAQLGCWSDEFAVVAVPLRIEGVQKDIFEETVGSDALSFGTVKARW